MDIENLKKMYGDDLLDIISMGAALQYIQELSPIKEKVLEFIEQYRKGGIVKHTPQG